MSFDIVISNGSIIDGTGNLWYFADLALKEGKIQAVGKLESWIVSLPRDLLMPMG